MKIRRYLYKYIAYGAVMMLMGSMMMLTSSTQEDAPTATFNAYDCVYMPETDTVQIPAVLLGADGEAIPLADYTVSVDIPDNEQNVFEGQVSVTPLTQRPPLQMILVLDITETVPLQRLIVELQGQFFPQLNPQDEIALITFGNDISPITQFYVDKERLFEEQFLNLFVEVGDNRMYDALRDAVFNMPMNIGQRQVILMITDSRPRVDQIPPQTPLEDIVEEAVDNNIQIYTLGYYSRDLPDEEGLLQVALGTGGYAWFSRDNSTIENIERGIIEQLNNVVEGLNTEVLIEIPLAGVSPNVNNQVTLDLTVDLLNDPTLTASVNCVIDRVVNTIAFDDVPSELTIGGIVVEFNVVIESPLDEDERNVVFLRDDEIVQNEEDEESYRFIAGAVDPGTYTFRAELRDESEEVLATTEEVTVTSQWLLQLSSRQENETTVIFDAVAAIDISANSEVTLLNPSVQFFIAFENNPNSTVRLSEESIPLLFDPLGQSQPQATLRFTQEDFENLDVVVNSGQTVLITARIANPVEGELPLAFSNALTFTVPTFPEPEVEEVPEAVIVVPEEEDDINRGAVLFVSSMVFFVVFNILLFRQNARERIKRRIRNPDRYDLDDHLMTVTVQRDGMRQSFRLTKKTISIGRGSMNDINLGGDADISRQHGVIMWRRQAWYYSNRKRQVSARIDGKWYRGYVFRKLEPITNIEIGNTHLVFHSSAQQDISEFISTNI